MARPLRLQFPGAVYHLLRPEEIGRPQFTIQTKTVRSFCSNYSKSGGKITAGSPIKTFGDDMYNLSPVVIPEFFYREIA
ncbi:MAG: hypothetical protein GY702_24945 [Desulfobulbaceae bacterium]|nr:hypothetical protein [Desulfobulbaceae bacterium]